MKTLKFLFLALIAVSVFGCGEPCTADKPRHLQPIDWEVWNDVYTVYWNSRIDCSDADAGNGSIFGREIKISGFVHFNGIYPNGNYDNPYLYEQNEDEDARVYFIFDTDSILTILTQTDLSKRCYITGKLGSGEPTRNINCCTSAEIYNIKNIYFEE